MSKTIGASLKAHLALSATTLAYLLRIVRATDGAVYGFTSHSSDLVVSGTTYYSVPSFNASSISAKIGANVDNLEAQGSFESAYVTEQDLLNGLWSFASFQIFLVNYADLTQGTLLLRKGWFGEEKIEGVGFGIELRGLMQIVQQTIGRSVLSACDADLGDTRCGINLGTFPNGRVTTPITSVTSNRVFVASGLAQASGWFDGGKLSFNAPAANKNLSGEVKTFTSGGNITMQLPFPYTVTIGDSITIEKGCDKLQSTCIGTFANGNRFRGFPHVPGLDRLVSGGA